MTRLDDMLARYGECVGFSTAGRILARCPQTIKAMIQDGRLRTACAGTRVDVRSIVEYIEAPAQIEEQGRKTRLGRRWMV